MQIRPLRDVDDVRGVHRVNVRAWRAAYRGVVADALLDRRTPTVSEDRARERVEHVRRSDGVFLVAEANEEIVGYAFARWGDETKPFVGEHEAGLKELYVDPDAWGEGIGTALLERVRDTLPADVDALKLETLTGNDRGRGFYESRGFERVGETTVEFGGVELDAVVYERDVCTAGSG